MNRRGQGSRFRQSVKRLPAVLLVRGIRSGPRRLDGRMSSSARHLANCSARRQRRGPSMASDQVGLAIAQLLSGRHAVASVRALLQCSQHTSSLVILCNLRPCQHRQRPRVDDDKLSQSHCVRAVFIRVQHRFERLCGVH